ncbi:hypothetical protein TrVGV298_007959 [Trichoderma virens]|nr:hypothetical protein TrVGV298_007959 [Trichoderma virens]
MASALLRSFFSPAAALTAKLPSASISPISRLQTATASPLLFSSPLLRAFSTTPAPQATLNQVLRGIRKGKRARHAVSPALSNTHCPALKGVCLRVGVVRPKKPNSVRGALDLGGVASRTTSRSKYGTKKPKKATVG